MGQEVQLFIVGTWGEGVTVWVHGGRGQSGGPTACSGYIYMKAGGPIHVHVAGVQLLTVGTWAGCPADSGYIRVGRFS